MEQEQSSLESGIDLSQGYCIKVHVLPDGFKVSEPEPIEEYAAEESETDEPETEDELIPDLASMLKNVMAVVQGNPVGESEQSAFEKSASS